MIYTSLLCMYTPPEAAGGADHGWAAGKAGWSRLRLATSSHRDQTRRRDANYYIDIGTTCGVGSGAGISRRPLPAP